MSDTRRERRLWAAAAAYAALVLISAYSIQFVMTYLREQGWLFTTVALLFGGVALVLTVGLARARPGRPEVLLLLLAASIYLYLLDGLDVLQERFHLIQYGALAWLLFLAFEARHRRQGSPPAWWRHPAWGAVLVTAAVGWADEGVQALLPNRTYDLRDVRLNALSGALFVGVLVARRWLRRQPPAASSRRLP